MINSYDDLSPVQLDVLKEIGNIGSCRNGAVTASWQEHRYAGAAGKAYGRS